MAKSPDYIAANATRQYTRPYNTQTLLQVNFAKYAWDDPKYALGMLIGNAIGQNYLNNKQKQADQMLFRQQNPVSMPDDVPLYDTNSTPMMADGKTAAIGNAYSGFGANPNQVAADYLTNLQNVPGRLNYNADTGAVNYQSPTFLPSMYADNNLGKYYPTATDADGNLMGNISFADYLNNQSKAGNGKGLLDFNTLQQMAASDTAKSNNPQATVAQSMGVLPTANVDIPPVSKQNIPAITGQLGQPINGNLSFGQSNLDNAWKYKNPYLKSDGNVADALPIDTTSAIQDNVPIKPVDDTPIKEPDAPIKDNNEQPIKAVNDAQTNQQIQGDTQDQQQNKTPSSVEQAANNGDNKSGLFPNDPQKLMNQLFPGETQIDNPDYKDLLDKYNKETDPTKKQELSSQLDNTPAYLLRSENPEYVAAKQIVDAETDPKKKTEMKGYLNNIARYNTRPLAPTEGSLRTSLNGNIPPHIDAQKNESDFTHWAIQHDMPIEVVNSTLERYRPQWQAQENDYNQYRAGQIAAQYWNAINQGNYSDASIYAQAMQQYDPNIASYLLSNTPGGRDFYATGVKKEMADIGDQIKRRQMAVTNQYANDRIILQGKVNSTLQNNRMRWQSSEKEKERKFKEWEDNFKASQRPSGRSGGSSSGGNTDKDAVANAYKFVNYWEKEHEKDEDNSWKSNSDYINSKNLISRSVNPNYDLSNYNDLYSFATDMIMDKANGQNNLSDVEIAKALYAANSADAPSVIQDLRKSGYSIPFLNP